MKLSSITAAAVCALGLAATAPATASTFIFVTTLSSAGEPVPTSTATGSAQVTFDDVAGTVAVSLSWAGLANAAPFGHIHCCTAVPGTGNSGVSLDFGALQPATTGSLNASYTPGNFATLLAGVQAGRAYVNIHTPGTYQAGEIRGFLAPIPEPGTWALMLGGLAAVGGIARRRRG
jgi:hypothetical protein